MITRILYPTWTEVKEASHVQLAFWHRFLPSPGINACLRGEAPEKVQSFISEETAIMKYLEERLARCGGMTTEISKQIGWTVPNGS